MVEETLLEKFQRFLTSYILIVPLLIIFSPLFKLHNFIIMNSFGGLRNDPTNHARKVKDVQDQVRAWNQRGKTEGKFMCTARQGWKKMALHSFSKAKYTQISLDLNDVVEVDTVNKVLTVEPGMMMKRLTSILLPMGWTIPVVPELDTLTVGGCICGAGLETSSHKYGLFVDTCISFEVVLPDGSVVTCSKKDEYSDLFSSIPGSYGTLGFLTCVKIRLIPATKYVRLEYIPLNSIEKTMTLLQDKSPDFIEGIVYSPQEIVVTFGNMVNDNEVDFKKINRINSWYKPWFHKHMESFLRKRTGRRGKGNLYEEYITLADYYHRHTRSYFWEIAVILPFGNQPLFRYLFGWLYPFNFQMCRLLATRDLWEVFFVKKHVLQDFVQPIETLPATLKFIHDLVEVYPIWLCPVSVEKRPGMITASDLYVDIGVYGDTPKVKEFHPVNTIKTMETYVIENKGFQGLYADSYLTHEQFKQMFDMSLYDQVRAKYNCLDAFPDVYDKVSALARQK